MSDYSTPLVTNQIADTLAAKARLRRELIGRRGALSEQYRLDAAVRLRDLAIDDLFDRTKPGSIVAGYSPIKQEIDPRPLMAALAAHARDIALPVILGPDQPLTFRLWSPDDGVVQGPLGTVMPTEEAQTVIPDLVLLPLVGFDRQRNRLGYGRGYYDRTLQALRTLKALEAFGIAFAAQEVDELPIDAWDQPLDMILTELGVR